VAAGPAQTRRVVEEARRDRLHNARRRPPAISAPVGLNYSATGGGSLEA